ncbi:toxin MIT1-like [Fopius arisanus]|uniref:Toxin MIT1-like n=1 Tax=Fopius arisanus TaxID=64838 RepID=A0A9R1TYT0_9HYME|nr:PREDICTED: toxin MIT1-like [Fopius arisanus]
MMTLRKILLVSALVGCCLALPSGDETTPTPVKECKGQEDCQSHECCTASPYRNTVATCRPRTPEGQSCSPDQQPTETGGSIYFAHCPCEPKLNCVREQGLCVRT